MKKSLIICFAIFLGILSCKKNDSIAPTPEEIQTKKIADILPQQYIDTLTKLGLVINKGTTPPNIEGSFNVKPSKLKSSNIKTDVIGMSFNDAGVKFFGQNQNDFSIKLLGRHFVGELDTSIVTAISGSGNDFTVYGKVKANIGVNTAYFAILISGVKAGNTIRNLTYGIINIDNKNGGNAFIKEGSGRIAYDTDLVSETTNFETIAAIRDNHSLFSPARLKAQE